jgi:hypothetical protein
VQRSCGGAVGSSLSGGHVVAIAADDPRIAAVAQVPWFGDPRTPGQTLRQLLTVSSLRLVVAGIGDAIRGDRGRPPYLVSVVGKLRDELPVAVSVEALQQDS